MRIQEIYDTLNRQKDITKTSRTIDVFGPKPPEDGDLIDEANVICLDGDYTSKTYRARQVMHFGETEQLSQQPSRTRGDCLIRGSDMLVLAYGGILEHTGYNEMVDMHCWRMSGDFEKLVSGSDLLTQESITISDYPEIDVFVQTAIDNSDLRKVYQTLCKY